MIKSTLTIALFLTQALALGSQDQNFGLGGNTTGRASGVTAETENAFAALYNPALLSAQEKGLLQLSAAATGTAHNPLGKVLVDAPGFRTEHGLERTENYQPEGSKMSLWAVGVSQPFSIPFWSGHRAGLGVAASSPFNRLRIFRARSPYDFQLLRYGTSDSSFKGTVSGAVELIPGWLHAGAGISLYLTSSGSADATFVSDNPTGRMALDIGLNTSLVTGLLANFERSRVALVYRQAIDPIFEQKFQGTVELGGTETFRQPFIMRSSLYFEPETIELEGQHDFESWVASVGLSFQRWKGYQPAYLLIQTEDSDGKIVGTKSPTIGMRDTFNPRASASVPLYARKLWMDAGYQFRPTPVSDLSGSANILDADTHIGSLGLRWNLAAGEFLPAALDLGLYAQYHWIGRRKVTKAQADFIGAPGYDFSGNAYTYGLSARISL